MHMVLLTRVYREDVCGAASSPQPPLQLGCEHEQLDFGVCVCPVVIAHVPLVPAKQHSTTEA